MEPRREVYAGVQPLRFTSMESFKCSSVSLVLHFDFDTLIPEKAESQRYAVTNKADIIKAT